ncbi:hypothetical protein ACKI2N_001890 [Cupriavidus sp. 30B13]|uniref:hypothetical protein n=1 Tax=Cupriavidus sp. 30B13 TaxID=3384241 RepID=UPI003B9064A9
MTNSLYARLVLHLIAPALRKWQPWGMSRPSRPVTIREAQLLMNYLRSSRECRGVDVSNRVLLSDFHVDDDTLVSASSAHGGANSKLAIFGGFQFQAVVVNGRKRHFGSLCNVWKWVAPILLKRLGKCQFPT